MVTSELPPLALICQRGHQHARTGSSNPVRVAFSETTRQFSSGLNLEHLDQGFPDGTGDATDLHGVSARR